MTRFPHDRFDDVTDGPRVGAHRGMHRRGRGWIAFAWAALATGVLVGIGVLVLALLNGSYSFSGPASSSSPSASSSASAAPSESASPSEPAAAAPSDQGSTTLVVLNGTTTAGLAAKGTATLTTAGWTVTSSGNAGTTGTASTVVYYQQESQKALAEGIAKSIGTTAVEQSAAFPNADISVVLGADYTG